MKKIIALFLLATLVLTSCATATVFVEGEVEEKAEIAENDIEEKEDTTPDAAETAPTEEPADTKEEVEEVADEIISSKNETPAIAIPDESNAVTPIPDENELEAIEVDFDSITEEELTELLESVFTSGQVIEFPILPIEPKE